MIEDCKCTNDIIKSSLNKFIATMYAHTVLNFKHKISFTFQSTSVEIKKKIFYDAVNYIFRN